MFHVIDDFVDTDTSDSIMNFVFGTTNLSNAEGIMGNLQFAVKFDETSPGSISFFRMLYSEKVNYSEPILHDFITEHIHSHPLLSGKIPIRGRCYLQLPGLCEAKFKKPHTDSSDDHLVALYYVNNSDGNTIFYDSADNPTGIEIEPKKGRLLIFDGKMRHGAGVPKFSPRCVINYNFSY